MVNEHGMAATPFPPLRAYLNIQRRKRNQTKPGNKGKITKSCLKDRTGQDRTGHTPLLQKRFAEMKNGNARAPPGMIHIYTKS